MSVQRVSTVPRYRLGRGLKAVELSAEYVCLEGTLRLRPGRVVELADFPFPPGQNPRQALVESWTVSRLGKNGPTYRGLCRWLDSAG